jgi:uncharacterized membrane protein
VLVLLPLLLSSGGSIAYCRIEGSVALVRVVTYLDSEYTTLPTVGKPIAVVNSSAKVYTNLGEGYVEVLYLGEPGNISVTYLTELAELSDGLYVAEFYNPYDELVVYLKLSAVIVEVVNLSHMARRGDYYELRFPKGYVKLVYTYIEASSGGRPGLPWSYLYVAVATVLAGSGALAFYYIRRRRGERLPEGLDERDATIIRALESGPKTPQELLKELDMSKATFYRRVKRLISLGYIEQVRRDGKVYYRLKSRRKS